MTRTARDELSVRACGADALFVSVLQCSDQPSVSQIRQAIAAAIHAFGYSGCAERVAQEFGDHPDTAGVRMRWARGMACEIFGDSAAKFARAAIGLLVIDFSHQGHEDHRAFGLADARPAKSAGSKAFGLGVRADPRRLAGRLTAACTERASRRRR